MWDTFPPKERGAHVPGATLLLGPRLLSLGWHTLGLGLFQPSLHFQPPEV